MPAHKTPEERHAKGTVFLVDDDPLLIESLEALLTQEGFATQIFSSGAAFLKFYATYSPQFPGPQCVVSDVNMPRMSGLTLQQRLEEYPALPILLMSGVNRIEHVVNGFRAGAMDFLFKPIEADVLLEAVQKVLALSLSQLQVQQQTDQAHQFVDQLSEREREILRRVALGQLNKQIADDLSLGLRTVKLYRQQAMEKLGLEKSVQLIPLADAGIL